MNATSFIHNLINCLIKFSLVLVYFNLKYILDRENSLKVNSLSFNKLSYKIFIYTNKTVRNIQISEFLMHKIILNKWWTFLKMSVKKNVIITITLYHV